MKSGHRVLKYKYKKQKAHARYAIFLRRWQITGLIIMFKTMGECDIDIFLERFFLKTKSIEL